MENSMHDGTVLQQQHYRTFWFLPCVRHRVQKCADTMTKSFSPKIFQRTRAVYFGAKQTHFVEQYHTREMHESEQTNENPISQYRITRPCIIERCKVPFSISRYKQFNYSEFTKLSKSLKLIICLVWENTPKVYRHFSTRKLIN